MDLNQLNAVIASAQKGTIHTLQYHKVETRKGLAAANFHKVSTLQVRLCSYENMSKVKEYRAETGIGPNNPAVQNEVPTDCPCVYFNTKTGKHKLRVPLNGCKTLKVAYFIGDQEVTKDGYEQAIQALGYALQQSAPSKTGVEFRSFDVANIIDFK